MAKEIKKQKKWGFNFFIERYFKLILPLLVVLVLVLGYFIVISDQIKNYIESKNEDLSGAMTENLQLKNSKAYFEKKSGSNFINSNDLKYISMAVPSGYDFTSVVSQLTSLAQSYNFNVISVKADKAQPAPKSNPSGLKKIQIKMGVVGGEYDQFKSFLDGMERSAMVFDIQSIAFGKNNSYQLEIISYYFD